MEHFLFVAASLLLLAMSTATTSTASSRGGVEARVRAILAQLSLDEKIGQMTQAERQFATPDDVRKHFLGSVLSGGGSWPPAGNTPKNWADMVDEYQRAALSTPSRIPIIYGQDGVHGANNLLDSTVFPHQVGLGATRDASLVRDVARVLASELRACGTSWTFAPCVANARDERWGRSYESFGEDPALIGELARAFVEQLQSGGSDDVRLVGCVKHFIGDGGALWGTGRNKYFIDRGDCRDDGEKLHAIHARGYIEAIRAGVGTVMASHSSVNGLLMHQHRYLLTDYLKGELHFDGFVISDWNSVWDLNGTEYERVVSSVNAGVDQFMVPSDFVKFIDLTRDGVMRGDIPLSRIDDAVSRILRTKIRSGLFEFPFANRSYIADFGSQAHREVARRAVQESAVLLKNDRGLLPLSKKAKIFVAGQGADDIGLQCGGWTIAWQGGTGRVTKGTTIVEGLRGVVEPYGGSVTYNPEGKGAAGHDVAVIVVAELPYAEGDGDSKDMALRAKDRQMIAEVAKAKLPTVAIAHSGRPVIISEFVSSWDAIVAAFLPGSEAGCGLADVLLGDVKFTGKLPLSWPRSVDQEPINLGDHPYDPLFPFGWGL